MSKAKRLLAVALAAGALTAAIAPSSAFAFGPHDNACQGPNNQPNCPGGH